MFPGYPPWIGGHPVEIMLEASVKTAAIIGFAAVVAATYLSNAISAKPATGVSPVAALAPWSVQTPSGAAPRGPAPGSVNTASVRSAPGTVYGQVELRADSGGHYLPMVEVDGRQLPMVVDTGATFVSLSYADAQKIGVMPAPADFRVDVSTANGTIHAARVLLRQVRVDHLLVTDVPALVLPREVGGVSLLGMSFLNKLGSFEVASGTLVLRP